jgi:hypothetical protein
MRSSPAGSPASLRVIIQIPCFNEDAQLPGAVAAIHQALAEAPAESVDGRSLCWELLVVDLEEIWAG